MSENRAIVKMYKRRTSTIGLRLFTMCIRTLQGTAVSACAYVYTVNYNQISTVVLMEKHSRKQYQVLQ